MTDFAEEFNLDMDKVMANTVSHDDYMHEKLQDKDYQRIYLETSLEEFAKDVNISSIGSVGFYGFITFIYTYLISILLLNDVKNDEKNGVE